MKDSTFLIIGNLGVGSLASWAGHFVPVVVLIVGAMTFSITAVEVFCIRLADKGKEAPSA